MISYLSSTVTTCLSCTISDILSIISQSLKRSCDRDHAHLSEDLLIQRLIFYVAKQCTKFEVSMEIF